VRSIPILTVRNVSDRKDALSRVDTNAVCFTAGSVRSVVGALVALALAIMKFLQLTAVVRDIRNASMVVVPFSRSPVTVGRRDSNLLRLDAPSVSRHHGAFMFSRRGGLQYVDLSSANGSYIDDRRIQPDTPLDLSDSSVITIGPYQIIAHLELVPLNVAPSDPDATTNILGDARSPELPWVGAWKDTLARSEALHRVLAQHAPADILGRAAEMIEAVADLVIKYRGPGHSGSPLAIATAADEIVAYLLDPEAERERVGELRTLLAEMLRFPLTVVPGGTS